MTKYFGGLYLIFLFIVVSCNNSETSKTKSMSSENVIQKIDKIHEVGQVTLDDIKTLLMLSAPEQKDLLYKSGFVEISRDGYGREKKVGNTTNTVDELKGYSETFYDQIIGGERIISLFTYNRNHYLTLRETAKKLYKYKETTPGGSEIYIDGDLKVSFFVNSYQPQSFYAIGISVKK